MNLPLCRVIKNNTVLAWYSCWSILLITDRSTDEKKVKWGWCLSHQVGYTLDRSQIHIRDYTEAHKTFQLWTLFKPGVNLEPLITPTFMVFGLSEEARVLGVNPHIHRIIHFSERLQLRFLLETFLLCQAMHNHLTKVQSIYVLLQHNKICYVVINTLNVFNTYSAMLIRGERHIIFWSQQHLHQWFVMQLPVYIRLFRFTYFWGAYISVNLIDSTNTK